MALIRMYVVPNCSQWLSWPILWIVTVCVTYWTHSTAVCVLMVALTRLQLLTHPHPHHPPPPSHPLIRAICDITVAVKKVAQNLAEIVIEHYVVS